MIKVRFKTPVKALVTAIFGAWTFFPLYWIFTMSIKQPIEWTATPPAWVPLNPNLANYAVLFLGKFEYMPGLTYTILPVMPYLMNSVIITGGATALAVIIGFLAAYSISRHKTGGSFLIYFILCTRMFPGFGIAIPLVVMFAALGLMDTHYALILIYSSVTLVFTVLMMKSFIDGVPKELEEAAVVDGYSSTDVMFRVTLPLVKGGLAATALFTFIINWGEYFFALIFTHTKANTIPPQLGQYFVSSGVMYGPVAALGVMAIIPVVVLAIIIQKYLVVGLTFGAVKGR